MPYLLAIGLILIIGYLIGGVRRGRRLVSHESEGDRADLLPPPIPTEGSSPGDHP